MSTFDQFRFDLLIPRANFQKIEMALSLSASLLTSQLETHIILHEEWPLKEPRKLLQLQNGAADAHSIMILLPYRCCGPYWLLVLSLPKFKLLFFTLEDPTGRPIT